jgi:hypothetical protein
MALRKRRKNRDQQIHNAILDVDRFKAVRVVYEGPDHQEVEITLKSKDGEVVTLYVRSHMVPALITELTNAYEAINPPMYRGNQASNWQGMD